MIDEIEAIAAELTAHADSTIAEVTTSDVSMASRLRSWARRLRALSAPSVSGGRGAASTQDTSGPSGDVKVGPHDLLNGSHEQPSPSGFDSRLVHQSSGAAGGRGAATQGPPVHVAPDGLCDFGRNKGKPHEPTTVFRQSCQQHGQLLPMCNYCGHSWRCRFCEVAPADAEAGRREALRERLLTIQRHAIDGWNALDENHRNSDLCAVVDAVSALLDSPLSAVDE